jgi:hypothetical protein
VIPGAWLLVWVSIAAGELVIPTLTVLATSATEATCKTVADSMYRYHYVQAIQPEGYFVCVAPAGKG